MAPRSQDARILPDDLARSKAGDLGKSVVDRHDPVLLIGDHDRFRTVVEHLLGQQEPRLGLLAGGDVGVDGDKTAICRWRAAHLDYRSIAACALENMSLRNSGPVDDGCGNLLRVSIAILAPVGVEARDVEQSQWGLGQQLRREIEQATELLIEGDEIQLAIEQ